MTLQEICILLGKSENTIVYNFKRTQNNLKKKGIILTKQGRGNNANYSITFPSYTIYMHRNKINGKIYIGQTKQKLNARWRDGEGYKTQPYFYKAIQKYGWDNFEHIILEENLTLEQANNKEEYWIAYYQSNIKEFGYNILAGGNNHAWTEEMKQKQSKRFSGENGSFFGQKHTNEYKENMRKQMKEKWNNQDYKQQVCKNMKKIMQTLKVVITHRLKK